MFNFVFFCPKRWFKFNSRIVKHILQAFRLWIIKKWLQKRSYNFRWCSRFRWRRVCLSSLLTKFDVITVIQVLFRLQRKWSPKNSNLDGIWTLTTVIPVLRSSNDLPCSPDSSSSTLTSEESLPSVLCSFSRRSFLLFLPSSQYFLQSWRLLFVIQPIPHAGSFQFSVEVQFLRGGGEIPKGWWVFHVHYHRLNQRAKLH